MKHIAASFKGQYKYILSAPLFKLFEAILELLVPLIMAGMIDVGIRGRDAGYVLRGGGLLLAIALLSVVFALICQYFSAVAAGNVGRSLRNRLFAHVMGLSPGDAAKFGTGSLITRATNDVFQIQTGLNMAMRLATRVPFLIVGSVVMALTLNAAIGVVFLISTPLIFGVLVVITRRTLPSYRQIQAGNDAISRLAKENLEGARVIRAFSRQRREEGEFLAAGDDLTALVVRVGKVSAALNPLTGVIVNVAVIVIVWAGANFVFVGAMAPGEIVALVTYMNQTLLALIVAANLLVLFTRAIASGRRVGEVLDAQPSVTDGPGAVAVKDAPAVEFQNVRFAYHDGADAALEDISFRAARGEMIGIIGGIGSGKTTLVNLILRYYDAQGGAVYIGGADARDYALEDLRGRIGFVPQRAALFTGSVRRNLLLSAPGADDAAIWRALKTAQAEEFVRAMPEGLDTAIEEGGKNLSGGQRQRLTIARALVRDPDILILDDASSALDYATDAALRRALRALNDERRASASSGRAALTTFLISQRASALMHADLILVLDDGRIVASGTHKELIGANELYREICHAQGIFAQEGGAV
jgi:ATP-binding cassette subfamily B protein